MMKLVKNLLATAIVSLSAISLPALAHNHGGNYGSEPDIVATAVAAGNFTTLVAAVQAAGLVETLQGEGPFTVFAPTDEAFAKIDPATIEALLADPEALANILLYHVVPGKVMAATAVTLTSATTAQGQNLTLEVTEEGLRVDGALVIATDIETANGVIHVLDTVVMPQ